MDLYLTGLAPKLSIPGPCLAGEKCGGFCFFLLPTRCGGGKKSRLSDVLILSSGVQKLLPPVISHSGGAEPNTAVSSRTLPLTGECWRLRRSPGLLLSLLQSSINAEGNKAN